MSRPPPEQCWYTATGTDGMQLYCERGYHVDDNHQAHNVPAGAKWIAPAIRPLSELAASKV